MEHLSFSQKISIIGVNPYVIPPEEILEKLFSTANKYSGPIPVKGTINGKAFTQTLVKYAGAWRLYLNSIMRKAAGIDVGDMAHIEVMFDESSRDVPMHPKFKEALDKHPKAKEKFATFPPSRKKEINRYLNTLKTESSLAGNIDRIIRHLLGDKTVGYFVIMDYKK